MVGNDLLSHTVTRILPSALAGLTAGFGMGPGVPPPLVSPTNCYSPPAPDFDEWMPGAGVTLLPRLHLVPHLCRPSGSYDPPPHTRTGA